MSTVDGIIDADPGALKDMLPRINALAESMLSEAENVKKLPLGPTYSSPHTRSTDGPCELQIRALNRVLSATAQNMAGVMQATADYLTCVKEDLEAADNPNTGGA